MKQRVVDDVAQAGKQATDAIPHLVRKVISGSAAVVQGSCRFWQGPHKGTHSIL